MMRDGKREANAALDLTEAAMWGHASQRATSAFDRTPPSSPLSEFKTSDSATVNIKVMSKQEIINL